MPDPAAPAVREPRGYAKGAARREAIVDVATAFFARTGYRGATMLQIAAACGISRAGLLHHFPTKESLLEAVLARRDAVDGERAADGQEDPDGLAGLVHLLDLARRNAGVPAIVHLYAVLSAEAGDPEHPAHDYFVRRYARTRAALQASLERAAARGLLAPGVEPAALAVQVLALMDGLQVQWLLDPDGVDMAALLRDRVASCLTVPLPGG